MKRRAFTMIELLVAILILGVISALAVMTFNSITYSWTVSTEYMDKMQRSDYALNQLVSGLKSMYYPHAGQQDYNYGFYLYDNGDGKDPKSSDVIEWAKTGPSIVGSQNASADTVHRVQVMVLEEGDRDWKEPVNVTGLYARMCPDPALRPPQETDSSGTDYTFSNQDMYQPVLVADGIVGFNCRVMKEPAGTDTATGADMKNDNFEDEWEASNSVPYKVELTFFVADPEGKSYRTNTAPLMRIVRIPVFEQSQDGSTLPSEDKKNPPGTRRGGSSGTGTGGGADGPATGGGAGPGAGGRGAGGRGAGGAPGGGAPGGGAPGGAPGGGMGGAPAGGGGAP